MAVYQKRVTVIRCERCDYEWIPKDPEHLPAVCAESRLQVDLLEQATREAAGEAVSGLEASEAEYK
ncbi:MAG TPA: hypothetical protein VL049_29455 [Candidatus Dormibacteraeota bacterium]|nr:hypothetical protein [Candidatus Dormibacteraeota bacterium]